MDLTTNVTGLTFNNFTFSFSGLSVSGIQPTTLTAYNISSGDTLFDSKYLSIDSGNTLTQLINQKQNIITTGDTTQYIKGDGSLGILPTPGSLSFSGLTGKPTDLKGFGIVSGDTLFDGKYLNINALSNYYTSNQIDSKITILNNLIATAKTIVTTTAPTVISTTIITGSTATFAPGAWLGSGTTAIPYTLNMDTYPTSGSNIPVSSDGVYQALLSSTSDNTLSALKLLGSSIKGSLVGNPIMNQNNSTTISTNTIYYQIIYIPQNCNLNGATVWMNAGGVYTAVNYNGIGLYSVSGSNLKLVASTPTNSSLFKTSYSGVTVPFSKSVSVPAGIYYVAVSYQSTGETTTPKLYCVYSSTVTAALDFSNGHKLQGTIKGSTLPTTLTTSSINASGLALYITVY